MPLYKRPEELDEDIELIENPEVNVSDDTSPEEKTWAKRYGDLRRLMAQKERQFQDQLNAVQVKLQNSTAMTVPDVSDDDAIEQWVSEHPQIARIVMGIADRRANAATADVNARMQEIAKERAALDQQTAYRKVDEAHPDFFDAIRHEEAFHEWLGKKSQHLQNAIYGDDNDWKTAIDVITLYKAENGRSKPKKAPAAREAAEYIPSKPSATPNADRRIRWKESDIAKMTGAEYDRYEEQIAEAWKNGEVLMDISGGAR